MLRRRKSMAQCVFRNRARFEKLQQIVGAARLGADAGKLEPTERLAFDDRTCDATVDVQIADAKFPARLVDMRRRAGKNSPGQCEYGTIGDLDSMAKIARAHD